MGDPVATTSTVSQAAQVAKTVAATTGGLVVYGFSLNEWAAICSILVALTALLERIGVLELIKLCIAFAVHKLKEKK